MLFEGETLGKNRTDLSGNSLDVWRNVAEHCLVQTAACSILAETLDLPEGSRKDLERAAMIHDWDKKYQTTGLRRINGQISSGEISEEQGGKSKYEFFEESEEHSVNGMRLNGIAERIIEIASADGHPALLRVMAPNCSLEEKNTTLCWFNYRRKQHRPS